MWVGSLEAARLVGRTLMVNGASGVVAVRVYGLGNRVLVTIEGAGVLRGSGAMGVDEFDKKSAQKGPN